MDILHDRDYLSRRGFLAGSATAAGLLLTASGAKAQDDDEKKAPAGPPVGCAVIGLGPQGRAILAALSRTEGAKVVAVCEKYQPFLNRAKDTAPNAAAVTDPRMVLERSDVQAVFIATPTHQHREIAIPAVEAGKAVYCEAPLAHTIEDARAIALAGKASPQPFQVGLQNRANPQHKHVFNFVRTGGPTGKLVQAHAQWHRRTSWRREAPNDAREREINWRLNHEVSPGLIGEEGIHAIDTMNWMTNQLPVAVTGFGSIMAWNADRRRVPDTVQCVLDYPDGMRITYSATLANSFNGTYELLMGTASAILIRGDRAWLFKENDAELLGWEVYTQKEKVGDEEGLVLIADATKILSLGLKPGEQGSLLDAGKDALYYSVESFVNCVRERKKPDCDAVAGYQACVTALKANEAAVSGSRVEFKKEWFDLG
jgi:predicted dehydrogenase